MKDIQEKGGSSPSTGPVRQDEPSIYIKNIMQMEETIQCVIMHAITELNVDSIDVPSSFDGNTFNDLKVQHKSTFEQLSSALAENEDLSQRCHNLVQELSLQREHYSTLCTENKNLTSQLNNRTDENSQSMRFNERIYELQEKNKIVIEQNVSLESSRDDFKMSCSRYENENHKLDENFKQQQRIVAELYSTISVLQTIMEKAEFESKQSNDNLVQLQGENERLKQEINTLKEKNEELIFWKLSQINGGKTSLPKGSTSDALFPENFPPEAREKITIVLEHENKMPKEQSAGQESDEPAASSELEENTRRSTFNFGSPQAIDSQLISPASASKCVGKRRAHPKWAVQILEAWYFQNNAVYLLSER